MNVQEFMVGKSGIPMHLKGYQYIEEALNILLDEGVTKKLGYVEYKIAQKYNVKEPSVERAMRIAIKHSCKYMDKNIKKLLFEDKEHIAIKEYLKSIAYAMEQDMLNERKVILIKCKRFHGK